MELIDDLVDTIVSLDEKKSVDIARKLLEMGEDPLRILDAMTKASIAIGEKYEMGEYFVADLVLAGEILKQISELIKPKLKEMGKAREPVGRLVIGTVQGDIHDIGKNFVVTMA